MFQLRLGSPDRLRVPLIIYRSPQLLVKAAHRGSDCCVVTFDSFTDTTELDRSAFGEEFLAKHRISAVHVVNGRNHWYHEPDWREAVGAAREAAFSYARILTYGSSMGGYAALRFADHIGANGVLAFSPQYSIDPRKAPFENRWPKSRRRKWLPELSGPLSSAIPSVVVYDATIEPERLHAERIAEEMSVQTLILPHAGHHTAAFLSECGLLSDFVLQMAAGQPDLIAIGRQAKSRRKQSLHYLIALSDSAWRRKRSITALAIARRATDMAPVSPISWHHLGQLLSNLEKHDEALSAVRRSIELAPDIKALRLRLAETQRALGDHSGMLTTLRLLADTPMTQEAKWTIRTMTIEAHARRLVARIARAICHKAR